jgi:alpha-tubulin suppressor-like RCC1 family protein
VKFRDIAVGNDFVCGVSIAADLYCWGSNAYGELALPASLSYTLAPTDPVPGGRKFASVSAASVNVCGITTDNELLCWGHNESGLVGIGPVGTEVVRVPTPVGSPTRFRAVSVGAWTACAISTDDRLYCWGLGVRGNSGQVPASFTRSVPERF